MCLANKFITILLFSYRINKILTFVKYHHNFMTAKDQKIIEAHPHAKTYELLALGLSEKGFQELTKKEEIDKQEPAYKSKTIEPKRITPVYAGTIHNPSTFIKKQNGHNDVSVRNKATGSVKIMSVRAAQLAIKRPDQFEIL